MRSNRTSSDALISLVLAAAISPPAAASGGSCSWLPSGSGMNGEVLALTVYGGSGTPALYAAGWFTSAGGVAAQRVARWNGKAWSSLAPQGADWNVNALAVFDPGDGASLYAGGGFNKVGGVTAPKLARWNGSQWSGLGAASPSGAVMTLATIEFGGQTRLYAGGGFTSAGFSQLGRIGAWDGQAWHALGTGMDGFVHAIALFDDGTGPAIYAGGEFATAGGVAANGIARWDGTAWSALGSGLGGDSARVEALRVFDDGTGPALYAGGQFTSAGGVEAFHIARWDGRNWSAVGNQAFGSLNVVNTMEVFDDGLGPALFIGGFFGIGGDPALQNVARWDGRTWSAMGAGVSGGSVSALAAWDDGGGPTLHAGGDFTQAGGASGFRIARWRCEAPSPPSPDLNDDGSVDETDLGLMLGAWGACDRCPADLDGNGVVDGADLAMLLIIWGPV